MNFLSKKRRIVLIVSIILAIPLLALAWWLGSPLFIKDEVNEELPENLIIITPTTADPAAVLTGGDSENDAAEIDAMAEQVTAIEVKRGTFRNGDSFHQGSGEAIIYQLSTGEHLLRFENFEVTNGPDLHVYLVPRANQDAVNINGYIDLGTLKGNVGSQNYTIPADVVVPTEASVVIWCEPFAVLFSVATLQ